VLILAFAFIGQIHAAPITPYYAHSVSSLADASPHSPACNDVHNCRTLWSIIYSCLATIFACTWVSYHPDIPDRTHTRWRIRVTRLLTVLISFLVPELTVAKAASECWKVWKYKSPFQGACEMHVVCHVLICLAKAGLEPTHILPLCGVSSIPNGPNTH